ncbi:EcoA type I restriction-modification enzyme R subunit [Streptococcus suis]|nr:EcoA type I restriction-modification enzyme R subunit [Streptococcus suis]
MDILNSTVQVLDENGKLVTESLTDYTRKNILGTYATLTDFITAWHSADKKKVILEELYKKGVYLDAIREAENISEQEIDDFDLLLKLAYGQKSLTKTERIRNVKQSGYLFKYSEEARAVLEVLLDKYMDKGIGELESIETLKLPEFHVYGTPSKIVNTYFGNRKHYLEVIKELEEKLFAVA